MFNKHRKNVHESKNSPYKSFDNWEAFRPKPPVPPQQNKKSNPQKDK